MEYNFPNRWFHCAVLKRKPERYTHTHTKKAQQKPYKPNNKNKPDSTKLKFAFVCYIDLKYWLEFST